MPIRLNLLAETQAADEFRRRDPVKRAVWLAATLVGLVLAWSGYLQLRAMMIQREIAKDEAQMKSFTNEFQVVLQNKNKADEIRLRLGKLDQLTTNRFLHANALNALQQTMVDDVQLVRFKAEQIYSVTDEIKTRTNDTRVIQGKPATVTEKILVSLEGSDTSGNPGDQVPHYKKAVAENAYFKDILGKPNAVSLTKLSPPDSSINGKRGVLFTLECRFPEVTR